MRVILSVQHGLPYLKDRVSTHRNATTCDDGDVVAADDAADADVSDDCGGGDVSCDGGGEWVRLRFRRAVLDPSETAIFLLSLVVVTVLIFFELVRAPLLLSFRVVSPHSFSLQARRARHRR